MGDNQRATCRNLKPGGMCSDGRLLCSAWGNLRLEDILEISLAHGRIVRSPNLGDPSLPGLGGTGVVTDEAKAIWILEHDLRLGQCMTG